MEFTIGENIRAEIIEDTLVLKIDLKHDGPISKSGKSQIVATTRGNVPVADSGVMLGVNAYRPRKGN